MRPLTPLASPPSGLARACLTSALALSLLSGCSFLQRFEASNAPGNPIDDVIAVSVSVGWAANVALAAHAGQDLDCTSIADHCAGIGCLEEVTIEIDDACPLPLLNGGSGSISVWGTWLDEDQGLLHFDFSDARADGRQLIRDTLLGTLATQHDKGVTLLWAWQGVSLDEDEIATDQHLWAVEVERVGEGADPWTDSIRVDGISQLTAVGLGDEHSGQVVQVAVEEAIFAPECGLNPISGGAVWHEVGSEAVALQLVSFHDRCDGLADTGGLYWGGLELELVR
jgi:hypothetical protein